MPLQLEVVTPDKRVLHETVEHVVLPTLENGEIDVLPGHIPLITIIEPGALSYSQNGRMISIAIDRGFIQIYADTVSVLTEAAVDVAAVDPNAIDAARRNAEAALAEATASGADPAIIEELETKARFALVQKIVAESRR
jgi:F-type H+-transporting ATPase subunit epsilon